MATSDHIVGGPPSVDLSIVIPAYNAAGFLETRMGALSEYLAESDLGSWEIVLVDDGSADGTAAALERLDVPNLVPIISPRNEGKFGAIRRGMAAARGRCRIFTDADVPYVCDHIETMARRVLEHDAHIVVGDRTLAQSHYKADLPPLRRIATDGFKLLVRLLVTDQLSDTQCGLKAFRADVAEALFPLMQERRFCGDVELLTIALLHGLEVQRVPVVLAFHGATTVRPLVDGAAMVRGLARIRWRRMRGQYDSEAMRTLAP